MAAEDATATVEVTPPPAHRVHTRVRHGMRRPSNWIQLVRFGAVGASGYVVNLAVFALCVSVLDLHYLLAAVFAFVVAVSNNFVWNRHWTFAAGGGHAGFQAARFFAVSLFAFAFNLVALQLLAGAAGVPEVPAQAISIVLATPMNFVGNKLWTFRA
jgi:dolichol-phosphate mannosyltransferase